MGPITPTIPKIGCTLGPIITRFMPPTLLFTQYSQLEFILHKKLNSFAYDFRSELFGRLGFAHGFEVFLGEGQHSSHKHANVWVYNFLEEEIPPKTCTHQFYALVVSIESTKKVLIESFLVSIRN